MCNPAQKNDFHEAEVMGHQWILTDEQASSMSLGVFQSSMAAFTTLVGASGIEVT